MPLSLNVTPAGSVPEGVIDGAGAPVVVTPNVPAAPTANVVEAALVTIAGRSTCSRKDCCASVPTPLCAVIVTAYDVAAPAPAEPDSVAVPLPLSVNVTPVGSVPDSDSVGDGVPVDVTVKEADVPTTNLVDVALVIAACWCTVSTNACTASVPMPLCAVNVSG